MSFRFGAGVAPLAHAGAVVFTAVALAAGEPADRAITRDGVHALLLPVAITQTPEFDDLEYDGPPYVGVRVDVDGDGADEVFVRSAARLCGNGGCPWAIFDGASQRPLGTVFGSALLVRGERSGGHAVIAAYAAQSADTATWTTYAYDGGRYVPVASETLSGAALARLREQLRRARRVR